MENEKDIKTTISDTGKGWVVTYSEAPLKTPNEVFFTMIDLPTLPSRKGGNTQFVLAACTHCSLSCPLSVQLCWHFKCGRFLIVSATRRAAAGAKKQREKTQNKRTCLQSRHREGVCVRSTRTCL